MASVFWDSKGVILMDYLKKSKPAPFYTDYVKKRLGVLRQKVLFHQDKPGIQTIVQSRDEIHNCASPCLFSWFGPVWLSSFPESEKTLR